MVTLLIFLSLLGFQESWQEIRILKLVNVLEDPFLIQEIEVYLLILNNLFLSFYKAPNSRIMTRSVRQKGVLPLSHVIGDQVLREYRHPIFFPKVE